MKVIYIILTLSILNSFISFAQVDKNNFTKINLTDIEYIASHTLVDSKNYIVKKGFRFYEKYEDEDWYINQNRSIIRIEPKSMNVTYNIMSDSHYNELKNSLNKLGYRFYRTQDMAKIYEKPFYNVLFFPYDPETKYYTISILKTRSSFTNSELEKISEKSDNIYSHEKDSNNSTIFVSKELSYAKKINSNKLEINSETNSTTLNLRKGDEITFSSSGQIRLGAFAGYGTPNGIDGFTGYNRIEGFRHGSLLGRIGNGNWFFIGESKSIIADREGQLQLMVNDDAISDNTGSFVVEYSITKPNYSNNNFPQTKPQNTYSPPTPTKTIEPSSNNNLNIANYIGQIKNKTINTSDGCKMTLIPLLDGGYRLKGITDYKKLVGRWNIDGKLSGNNYIFQGDIYLDGGNSSWPVGTKAPVIFTLYKTSNGIKGFYTIMSNYNGVERQEGEFTLIQN